jgi:hypothetical protein
MQTAITIRVRQNYSGGPVTLKAELLYDGHVVAQQKASVNADEAGGLTREHLAHLIGAVKSRLALDFDQLTLWD